MFQTILSYATFLARVPDASSSGIERFIFFSPSNEFVNNSIDVWNEDMLYKWTNMASMFISKAGRPFRVIKEMHPSTI